MPPRRRIKKWYRIEPIGFGRMSYPADAIKDAYDCGHDPSGAYHRMHTITAQFPLCEFMLYEVKAAPLWSEINGTCTKDYVS